MEQRLEASHGVLVNGGQVSVGSQAGAGARVAEGLLQLTDILTRSTCGDEGGAEGGGVGNLEAFDRGLKDVADDLGDAIVLGGATGEADALGLYAHPFAAQVHVEELAFQEGAHLECGVAVFKCFGAAQDGLGEIVAWGDLRAVEGEHEVAAGGIGGGAEGGAVEGIPVEPMGIA